MELQKEVNNTQMIVQDSTEKYDNIDLDSLNEQIGNVSDEVAARLEEFNQKSSELYSNILAALGKNGVVSGSQNMTAMAQQSTRIASDQTAVSEDIVMTSDDAVDIAERAYELALNVTKAPEELAQQLDDLKRSIEDGNDLLDMVNQTAQEALDKASEIYNDALDSLNEAERVVVPDVDTSIYLDEAKALLKEAEQQKNQTVDLMSQYEMVLNDTAEWMKKAQVSYNKTYTEQQITDGLLAEVDVALQKALQAIQDSEDFLIRAREQLANLLDFDRTVKESKEKALEALKRIPEIERILDEADNETLRASEAVKGAESAANDSKDIAEEAQKTANEASKNAAEILAEAQETKIAADTQSNITDEHGLKLNEIELRLNELEPNAVADGELIALVLTEAEKARREANESSTILMLAKEQVNDIITKLQNLPELDTDELDMLEEEMTRIEEQFAMANISKQVDELTQFSEQQRNLVQTHANSLSQLKADVANIEMIVQTVPDDPNCFAPIKLERSPTLKKRRRQRKAKKRLRH